MKTIVSKNYKDVNEEAAFYADLGWFPTPGKIREKIPLKGRGWNKINLTGPAILEQFKDAKSTPMNVGLLVGRDCVDVDLDSPGSRRLARYLLPDSIKLQKENKVTHYLYSLDSTIELIKSKQYLLPSGEVSVEIRGVDGNGNYQYTMVSPSIHPSGARIERIGDKPTVVLKEEAFEARVRLVAICDVLLSHWVGGGRHNMAMGVAGFLLKRGYEPELVNKAIEALCEESGDDESRARQVKDTIRKFERGDAISGEQTLKEHLPEDSLARIKSWFGSKTVNLEDFNLDDIQELPVVHQYPYLCYLAEPDAYTTNGLLMRRTQVTDLYSGLFNAKEMRTLINQCPKLMGMAYKPSQGLIATQGPQQYWNIWRPTDIVPKKGDVKLFLKHINSLCDGDEQAIDTLMSFMAHALQKPSEKVRWMPVLIGGQGTGKTTMVDILGRLVGASNYASISAQDMLGDWTGDLEGKLVVGIEEMRISRSSASTALATALKEKITNNTLNIKKKYISDYSIDNIIRFVGLSNYRSPIEIEHSDRRYYVITSRTTDGDAKVISEATKSWLPGYHNWLNSGGYSHIMYYLMKIDASRFTPNAAPEMSLEMIQHKMEIQEQTSSPEYADEVQSVITSIDKNIVTSVELLEAFSAQFPKVNMSAKRLIPIARYLGVKYVRGVARECGYTKRITLLLCGNTDAQVVTNFTDLYKSYKNDNLDNF